MRIDELVADLGGEVPRAEGVGGGKPPPNGCSDTPDRGSADFEQFLHQAAQVVKMDDLRAMAPIYVQKLALLRGADVQRVLCTF